MPEACVSVRTHSDTRHKAVLQGTKPCVNVIRSYILSLKHHSAVLRLPGSNDLGCGAEVCCLHDSATPVASAIAVAHDPASSFDDAFSVAMLRRAACMMPLLWRRQQHSSHGRRAYDRVSSWGDACSGTKARCSDHAAAREAAAVLRQRSSRIRSRQLMVRRVQRRQGSLQ